MGREDIHLSDFSGGIVEDVDSHDAGPNTLSDSLNLDHMPGKSRLRSSTVAKLFRKVSYDHLTKTFYPAGWGPGADEEIVQVEEVKAPDARAGSIKLFTTANTVMGTPVEHCLNPNVTIIMLTRLNGTSVIYDIWGDIHEKDSYEHLAMLYPRDESEIPFMIPSQSCVDIGNVKTSTGEGGVVWIGHIKKLIGWTRVWSGSSSTYEYAYLGWRDEWRVCDSECYNAGGNVTVGLLVANIERAWQGASSMYVDLETAYSIKGEDAFKELVGGYSIGARQTVFRVKVTALYDGFQESRPLRHNGTPTLQVFRYDRGAGDVEAATPSLPSNWTIETDEENGQFLRIRMGENRRRTRTTLLFAARRDEHDLILEGNDLSNSDLFWEVGLVWNQEWTEEGGIERTGEGFQLTVVTGNAWDNLGSSGRGFYEWKWDQGKRVGLVLRTVGNAASSKVLAFEMGVGGLDGILWLMGASVPIPFDILQAGGGTEQGARAVFPDLFAERDLCRSLWTIEREEFWIDPAFTWVDGTTMTKEELQLLLHHSFGPNLGFFMTPEGERVVGPTPFQVAGYSGRGVLAVLPALNGRLVSVLNGDYDQILSLGVARITGFRIYVMEEDVDIDYTLRKEIRLDHNPGDVNFGGMDEPEDVRETFRDGPDETAPMWRLFQPAILGADPVLLPYYEERFIPEPASNFTGLQFRGGLPKDFIISDNTLTDGAGNSTLSGNLLRNENERDAPLWTRGALCEGHLLAIGHEDGLIQYSIVAGGVAQHNIIPKMARIQIGKDELPTHIVSWRGLFHLVFTDKGIHRFDLADGDEMSWRVIDSFAGHGTIFWRAIVNTPNGVFYATRDGIFQYEGNSPQNLTWGFWQDRYLVAAQNFDPNSTFAGYNSREGRILFSYTNGEGNVWVLDLRLKAWWKYRYMHETGWAILPRYMRMWDGDFFMSMGPGDARVHLKSLVPGYDVVTTRGYCAYMITNEIAPADLLSEMHHTHIAILYRSGGGPARYKLIYGPYNQPSGNERFPYSHVKSVALPSDRKSWMHPMPIGITGFVKVMVGRGDAFFTEGGSPMPNPTTDFEIRMISLSPSANEREVQ